jgi:signal transduction histidine kinase
LELLTPASDRPPPAWGMQGRRLRTTVELVEQVRSRWRRARVVDARWIEWGVASAMAVGAQLEYNQSSLTSTDLIRRVLLLIATAPLAYRRRFPVAVFGITFTAALAAPTNVGFFVFVSLLIATYSAAAYSRQGVWTLALLLSAGAVIDIVYGGGAPPMPALAVPFAILLPIWLAGRSIRSRQLRAETLHERTQRMERERDAAMRQAIAEERTRIAHELHDVVTHNVSVMLVQAGAARKVLREEPEVAEESLLAVESSGREAMSELRHFLDLLGRDEPGVDLTPQPTLERVPELIERVCETGLRVELRIDGTPRALAAGVSLAAYRVIQEGLTNAMRYAAPAPVSVVVTYRDGLLKVEVLDEGITTRKSPDGGGRGLVGLRERVAVYGGKLESGRRLGGGYALRAYLPAVTAGPGASPG